MHVQEAKRFAELAHRDPTRLHSEIESLADLLAPDIIVSSGNRLELLQQRKFTLDAIALVAKTSPEQTTAVIPSLELLLKRWITHERTEKHPSMVSPETVVNGENLSWTIPQRILEIFFWISESQPQAIRAAVGTTIDFFKLSDIGKKEILIILYRLSQNHPESVSAATPVLCEYITYSDERIRGFVVATLLRIAKETKTTPDLESSEACHILEKTISQTRAMAVMLSEELIKQNKIDSSEELVQSLIDALQDPEPIVRKEAVGTLGTIALHQDIDIATPACEVLIDLIHDNDTDVQVEALKTVAVLTRGGGLPMAEPVLNAALTVIDSEEKYVRQWATDIIGRLVNQGFADEVDSAAPKLIELLGDSHEPVRGDAAMTLAAVAEAGHTEAVVPAVDQLRRLLRKDSTRVQEATARVIVQLAVNGRSADVAVTIPALADLLTTGDTNLQMTAANALATIGTVSHPEKVCASITEIASAFENQDHGRKFGIVYVISELAKTNPKKLSHHTDLIVNLLPNDEESLEIIRSVEDERIEPEGRNRIVEETNMTYRTRLLAIRLLLIQALNDVATVSPTAVRGHQTVLTKLIGGPERESVYALDILCRMTSETALATVDISVE